MKFIFKILILTSLCLPALAKKGGGQDGSGGVGKYVGKELHLLDFVEHGLGKFAVYNSKIRSNSEVLKRLESVFSEPELAALPISKLAHKVSEIMNNDILLGNRLLIALETLDWRISSDPLKRTNDERSAIAADYYQLATRQKHVVFLYKNALKAMPEDHIVGLLMHEAFFILATPRELLSEMFFQDARDVRNITGFVFTSKFARDGIKNHLNPSFPFYRETKLLVRKGTLDQYLQSIYLKVRNTRWELGFIYINVQDNRVVPSQGSIAEFCLNLRPITGYENLYTIKFQPVIVGPKPMILPFSTLGSTQSELKVIWTAGPENQFSTIYETPPVPVLDVNECQRLVDMYSIEALNEVLHEYETASTYMRP